MGHIKRPDKDQICELLINWDSVPGFQWLALFGCDWHERPKNPRAGPIISSYIVFDFTIVNELN